MSPSRTHSLSLAEAVTLLAWGQRFMAEDFMAVDGLKLNIGELRQYRRYIEEGKGPVVSSKDLKIYERAINDGWRLRKEMREASGAHPYTSKCGKKAITEQLDAAFAIIVKAIQDRRDTSARGLLDISDGSEGGIPIHWKWFPTYPEPTADWEMNVIQKERRMGTHLIDDDGEKWANPIRWRKVTFDRDEIERLRDENGAWPLNERSELAATDEPSAAPAADGAVENQMPAQATPAASSNMKPQGNCKRDGVADAALKPRIKRVLAIARRKWPDPKKRPEIDVMAKELARVHSRELQYKFETIRKILKGTYKTSKRLDIDGL